VRPGRRDAGTRVGRSRRRVRGGSAVVGPGARPVGAAGDGRAPGGGGGGCGGGTPARRARRAGAGRGRGGPRAPGGGGGGGGWGPRGSGTGGGWGGGWRRRAVRGTCVSRAGPCRRRSSPPTTSTPPTRRPCHDQRNPQTQSPYRAAGGLADGSGAARRPGQRR